MNRAILCVVLAVGWLAVKYAPHIDGVPIVRPIGELAELAKQMTPDDRAALSETYAILSRAVAANPAVDPVFPDVASIRRAHRAALLATWAGVMGNQPGKYPGLREALEGFLDRSAGDADVLLNPHLQEQIAKTFLDMSASLR